MGEIEGAAAAVIGDGRIGAIRHVHGAARDAREFPQLTGSLVFPES